MAIPGRQKNWGYQSFKSNDSLFKRYQSLTDKLEELIKQGLSAAVYTQTTDVEGEVNGFMTYDRKVMKMPIEKLRQPMKNYIMYRQIECDKMSIQLLKN